MVSNLHMVDKRVPQGAILGLLLFSIYIGYIHYSTEHDIVNFYADDTILYAIGANHGLNQITVCI